MLSIVFYDFILKQKEDLEVFFLFCVLYFEIATFNSAEKVLIESIPTDEGGDIMAPSPVPLAEPSTLHEILQQEKIEFEEKMERAARRKRWLMGKGSLL